MIWFLNKFKQSSSTLSLSQIQNFRTHLLVRPIVTNCQKFNESAGDQPTRTFLRSPMEVPPRGPVPLRHSLAPPQAGGRRSPLSRVRRCLLADVVDFAAARDAKTTPNPNNVQAALLLHERAKRFKEKRRYRDKKWTSSLTQRRIAFASTNPDSNATCTMVQPPMKTRKTQRDLVGLISWPR